MRGAVSRPGAIPRPRLPPGGENPVGRDGGDGHRPVIAASWRPPPISRHHQCAMDPSTARTHAKNVKRQTNGDQVLRRIASASLFIEDRLRRLLGHRGSAVYPSSVRRRDRRGPLVRDRRYSVLTNFSTPHKPCPPAPTLPEPGDVGLASLSSRPWGCPRLVFLITLRCSQSQNENWSKPA